jgi:NADH:ubiquinone oxidoreductase subunit 2 (subunit N)
MTLLLGVFSLGGIPPTIGFTGKFLVFVAAVEKGLFYLVLIGMINVVVSLSITMPSSSRPPISLPRKKSLGPLS